MEPIADVPPVSSWQANNDPSMRYLRVTITDGGDDVAMTLYEVDADGWVYRQCQMRADGTRFSPEDILMCRPVNLPAMLSHPCAEEIDAEDFELLWNEVVNERAFLSRLPDPRAPWEGTVDHGGRRFRLLWAPNAEVGTQWAAVPGFDDLFVMGDSSVARRACSAVFLDRPVQWRTTHAVTDAPARWPSAA